MTNNYILLIIFNYYVYKIFLLTYNFVNNKKINMESNELPLVVLRDLVVFPSTATVLMIGRQATINAVNKAYNKNKKIFCVTQKDSFSEEINQNNIFNIGVVCEITQKTVLNNNEVRIFIKCLYKAKIEHFIENNGFLSVIAKQIRSSRLKEDETEINDIKKIILNKAETYFKHNGKIPFEILGAFKIIDKTEDMIFILSSILSLEINAKQSILEERTELGQLKKLYEYLEIEMNLIETENKINNKINKKLQDTQKQYYLKEKLKLLKKELKDEDLEGDDENDDDTSLLKKQGKNIIFSKDAKEKFDRELKKLDSTPSYSPEYSTIKGYLEWLIELPWNKKDKIKNDIKKAEIILQRDHYGLEEVKERIIEFIAVYNRTNKLNGPIICFVGPPGVGKTSLAKSIAESINRKYIKISLGGVRDEAEIRGHRKTYVGAMPGKIIQSMKKAGTMNPLILLDEIDKMSFDSNRGDPASALLEVLDPEQNKTFNDHFLEIEYDLSNVMFIATANDLNNVPSPLKDRMEIIKISGYTEDEKLEIAKRYIVPKQLNLHGLKKIEFTIEDSSIIEIIRRYTFEAGVRNLERHIEQLIRKSTKKLVEKPELKSISISSNNLKDFLGIEKYDYNRAGEEPVVGVSNGLAYTEFGGDILYIEALKFNGTGKLLSTGKLGEVMKESVEAAFSYVRSKAENFGFTSEIFNKYDFHLHVPEGATPKDGPSAGVAISTALMSALTNMKIRGDIAMTGEITLTGKVLPIGGLKEKLLGALRGNIKKAIIPFENIKDLEKIPEKVKIQMEIIPVKTIEEAFKILLVDYEK